MSEIEGAKNLSESVVEDSELDLKPKTDKLGRAYATGRRKNQYLGSGLNMEIKKLQ